MSNKFKPLILISGGLIGFYTIYKKFNEKYKNLESENERIVINKEAEDLVVNEFKKIIKLNNNITIEEAILIFEDSKEKDLEKFAISKSRSKECYINTYKNLFEKARDNH